MSDEHSIDPDDGVTGAAEYVLGVLSLQQRRAFEARLIREPALRSEVEFWERKLAPLADEVRPVEPPAQAWRNIEAVVDQRTTRKPRALWDSLPFWRWAAVGSAAVAAASIALVVIRTPVQPSSQRLVARLDVSGGQLGFVAAVDPGGTGLTIVPASTANVTQRVLELWLVAPNDKPRSLGLIDAGRAIHIRLSPDTIRSIGADATLAVSVEPPGGSPTGQPTGPVIANGKLTNL
ncbi:anti-sigma factor [Rhodoplanes sp. Z2-YC6860]|uniref:anti-sigma factor n=1 Tax=Rhodoplanes sp. Z2-YC6860 TaxID=674703 RepID=UPI00078CC457|nr:anti-sigma factor [Rhodoplanes sp. Z2-YC6860]AMN40172.1 anti-sigma-K factor RskA [Rhodoplanes sp. Z2-YC6860]